MAEEGKGVVRAIVKRKASGMPEGANVGDEITMSEAQFEKHAAAGNVDNANTLTVSQMRGEASPSAGSAAEARQKEERETREAASNKDREAATKDEDAAPSRRR